MAIFGNKKEKKVEAKAKKPEAKAPAAKTPAGSFEGSKGAIIRPRVTEKSGVLSQGNVYTFEVSKEANKQTIAKAVRAIYKVTPVKIAVINKGPKNVFVRNRKGTIAGYKKAMVTVKKGEKIDFV